MKYLIKEKILITACGYSTYTRNSDMAMSVNM